MSRVPKNAQRDTNPHEKEQLSPQVYFYPPLYVVSSFWSINGFVPLLPHPPRSPVSWANNLLSFFFSSWQQRLRRRYLFPWSFPSDRRPSIFPFSLSLGVVAGGSPPSSVFRLHPSSRSHFCTTPFFADIVIIFLYFPFVSERKQSFWETGFIHIEKQVVVVVVEALIEALSQPFSLFFFFATAADSPESQNIPNLLSPLLAGKGVSVVA